MPVDPSVMRWIARIESGGNPNAQTGRYKGLYQLSNSEFSRYGGGDIFNPADNQRAASAKLDDESTSFRRQYGRDPSGFELYMVHQQGPGGFAAHYSNPDAPAWQNMASTAEGRQKGAGWAKQAIWGNVPDDVKANFPGGVDSLTSRQFMDLWQKKIDRFSGQPMAYAGDGTTPPPQTFSLPGQQFAAPDMENGLWQAAAALASISNPQQAAVLAKNVKDPNKNLVQPDYGLQIGPNGEVISYNKRTGTPTLHGELGRKVDESALKQQQDQLNTVAVAHGASQRAQDFIDKIDKGTLDVGWLQWPRAKVESALGLSSPQTQNYNSFQSFRQEAAQAILQAARGVQTEGDAQRAFSQFTDGVAAGDNATVRNALEKLIAINEQTIAIRRSGFDATSKAYRDNPAFEPIRKKYDEIGSFYSERKTPSAATPASGGSTPTRPPLSSFFK